MQVMSSGREPPIFLQLYVYDTENKVMDDLARADLESSNLIHGIDFTKSNEYTGSRSFQSKKLASSWRCYESLSTGNIYYCETLRNINMCQYVSRPAILSILFKQ